MWFARAALAAILAAGAARGGGPGTTAAPVLRVAAGARPEALGGAYAAVADDLNALFWNPAGLAGLTSVEVGAMYTAWFAGTGFQVLGGAAPAGRAGTVAGAGSLMDYGSVPRTTATADGLYGGVSGRASAMDAFATVGWGRRVAALPHFGEIAVGVSGQVLSQRLAGTGRTGGGVSAGALLRLPLRGVSVGLVADHLGAVGGGGGPLPFEGRGGVAWETAISSRARALWAADAGFSPDAGTTVHAGGELNLFEVVALRGGWRGAGAAVAGPTWGLGLVVPRGWLGPPVAMRLDYAGGAAGELGLTHRLQLVARFSPPSAGRPHGFKVAREGSKRALSWSGGRGPYDVTIRSASDRTVVWAADRPLGEPKLLLPDLAPGAYLVAIRPAVAGSTGWRREPGGEVKLTIPAPPPKPVAAAPAPVAPPLAAPGGVALEYVDGANWLKWQGGGPAWTVLMRPAAEDRVAPVPGDPLTEPRFHLPRLAPGIYYFVIRSVDPGDPSRRPADSPETEVVFKARAR
jgi:hypothetical protein